MKDSGRKDTGMQIDKSIEEILGSFAIDLLNTGKIETKGFYKTQLLSLISKIVSNKVLEADKLVNGIKGKEEFYKAWKEFVRGNTTD
jgi:hypothetical protein